MINCINQFIQLNSKLSTLSNKDAIRTLDSIYSFYKNPYILYKKMSILLQQGDRKKCKEIAQQFLTFNTPEHLIEYQQEFLEANNIIDSTYTSTSAPCININNNNITLDDCHIRTTYNIPVIVKNTGVKPLHIYQVLTSCNCVKCSNNFHNIIQGGDSTFINIEFTAENLGSFEREIYITSNSKENPIYTISIYATATN